MPFNVLQWRAGIENFYIDKLKCSSLFNLDLWNILTTFIFSYFSGRLLIQHGDIESNPGPSKK